jgi:hypothetical protein
MMDDTSSLGGAGLGARLHDLTGSGSDTTRIVLPPNPKYPNCITHVVGTGMESPGMCTLSSDHAGGAHVVLADGSVHFLKDNTSLPVIWALGSRSQGEVLSSDSYRASHQIRRFIPANITVPRANTTVLADQRRFGRVGRRGLWRGSIISGLARYLQ